MKAALVSLGSLSSKWIAEKMRSYFDEVDELELNMIEVNFSGKKSQLLYKGEPLKSYDCVLCRGSFRYANLLKTFSMILGPKVYVPIDPSSFTVMHDKLLTQLELQKNNIPMPTTFIAATTTGARSLLKRMNYPIIMKFPQGTQGKGVIFADSYASASSILDALDALRQPFLIQEYIETKGTDLRVIVVGDKVAAAYRRVAKQSESRANIHQGGTGEPVILDDATKRLSVRVAKAMNCEICAVDILESFRGPLVIEANISPGLQGITKYTKMDVADIIAQYLFNKTKEHVSKRQTATADKILTEIQHVDKGVSLITGLEMRGNRILLPELVSKHIRVQEDDSYEIKIENSNLSIKKFM